MINKFIAIGRLTRDPEVRHAGESTVTGFALALDDGYKGKDGQWVDKVVFTEWQLWNGAGKALADRAKKGDLIYVEGKYGINEWTDNEGNQRTAPRFTALAWKFLSSPGGSKAPKEENETEETPKPAKRGRPAKSEKKPEVKDSPEGDSEDTEDIPF